MQPFDPPASLTAAFTVLTLGVALADVALLRRAAPRAGRGRWTAIGAVVAVAWLGLHAALATSGVLERAGPPPAAMPYLSGVVLVAVAVAASRIGARLAGLPLALLVGLQGFRLPLEVLLHELYGAGALPVQMTWSGYNLDVLTGIGAIALAGALAMGRAPDAAVWAWNALGLALLVNVVGIAVTSAPLPIRLFHDEPAVVLLFHAPYNWIVNVHVWTALVGHLVIFRALWRRRHAA